MKLTGMCGVVMAAGLAMLANVSHAESFLALPDGGTLTLWDTSRDPAIVRMSGLSGGTAGVCYQISGNQVVPDADATACLSYLRVQGDVVTGGAERYDIVGRVRALDGQLGEYSRGFVISGVRGIGYCGERDNCDEIYISGVKGGAALNALAQAVRSGTRVRVQGQGVWNFESIDIVVDQITPAR